MEQKPLSRPLAIGCIIGGGLLLAVALVNPVINTSLIGSWLPLLALEAPPLGVGIWSLRANNRATVSESEEDSADSRGPHE
jgi:hypothetical protein